MSEVDLDIENYELEDILNLFRLQYNFVEADLKRAYRMALKLHPDKSGLDGEYFRFYMKAYKIVENIFNFRNRKKKCAYDVVYNAKETDISEDKAVLLHSLNGKSIKEFNKWFNEQFEKTKVNDDENDSGYGKWIKENEVSENNEKVSLSEFGRVFEKKKTDDIKLKFDFAWLHHQKSNKHHWQYWLLQLDNQLLTALDHGHVTKRLGGGKIEFDTRMTLWAGVQPARFDLTSGMGRRLQYLVFIPTKADNEYLMDTMHGNRNQAPNQKHLQGMWSDMLRFKDDMRKVQTVEFDDSVLKMYKSLGLYSFEASYFDRLVLGYQIAMYGPEKHMVVSMKDNMLLDIVAQQKKWRSQISMGIENIQLLKIIELAGDHPSRAQIVEDAAMYGWNAQQVFEMLKDMKMSGTISMSKKGIVEVLI